MQVDGATDPPDVPRIAKPLKVTRVQKDSRARKRTTVPKYTRVTNSRKVTEAPKDTEAMDVEDIEDVERASRRATKGGNHRTSKPKVRSSSNFVPFTHTHALQVTATTNEPARMSGGKGKTVDRGHAVPSPVEPAVDIVVSCSRPLRTFADVCLVRRVWWFRSVSE